MNAMYPYKNLFLKNIDGEKWKDIPGQDGYLRISNFGRIKRMPFEMQTVNGHIRRMSEKIMTPDLAIIKNHSVHDEVHFLRVKVRVEGKNYNYSVARMVYYCFVKKFDLSNYNLVVINKDGDGRNIHPGNLALVNISYKQKRIFERNRYVKNLADSYEEFIHEGLIKSANGSCKQISQYTQEGKKIQTYPSTQAASKVLGITENSINSVLKDRQVTAGGFVWRYGAEARIDMKTFRENKKVHRKMLIGQKVSQYDNEGKRVATYLTTVDAAKALGVCTSLVGFVLNKKRRTANGFILKKGWGKEKIDLSNCLYGVELRAQKQRKKVEQYSAEGAYIQTFPSLTDAALALGISLSYICRAISKKKPVKGFILSYAASI